MDKAYYKSMPRARKGNGRKCEICSVRVPIYIKSELDAWKNAYEQKLKRKISYEQMLRWWFDNIGYSDGCWDRDIRNSVESENNFVFPFDSKQELVDHLNKTGRLWEFCNKASAEISDDLLIEKSLLFLEFEDIPQLFKLYGYERCRSVFEKRILSKGKYYSNISFLLRSLFFSVS